MLRPVALVFLLFCCEEGGPLLLAAPPRPTGSAVVVPPPRLNCVGGVTRAPLTASASAAPRASDGGAEEPPPPPTPAHRRPAIGPVGRASTTLGGGNCGDTRLRPFGCWEVGFGGGCGLGLRLATRPEGIAARLPFFGFSASAPSSDLLRAPPRRRAPPLPSRLTELLLLARLRSEPWADEAAEERRRAREYATPSPPPPDSALPRRLPFFFCRCCSVSAAALFPLPCESSSWTSRFTFELLRRPFRTAFEGGTAIVVADAGEGTTFGWPRAATAAEEAPESEGGLALLLLPLLLLLA